MDVVKLASLNESYRTCKESFSESQNQEALRVIKSAINAFRARESSSNSQFELSRNERMLLSCTVSVLQHCKSAHLIHLELLISFLTHFISRGQHKDREIFSKFSTNIQKQERQINVPSSNDFLVEKNSTVPSHSLVRKQSYKPPHLRANNLPSTSYTPELILWSSESDQSDGESEGFGGVNKVNSQMKLLALKGIHALAQANPKSLHAFWKDLLPTHQVLNPKTTTPNLLSILLFDNSTKIRQKAATALLAMLEGPHLSPFLQLAKPISTLPAVTSYTPLSASLSQIVDQIFTAFLHIVNYENHLPTLCLSIRGLNRLISASQKQSNSCISQNKLMASIRKLYERILMFKSETRSFQDSEKGNSQIIAAMSVSITCLSSAFSSLQECKSTSNSTESIPPTDKSSDVDAISLQVFESISSFLPKTPNLKAPFSPLLLETLQALSAVVFSSPSLMSSHFWPILSPVFPLLISDMNNHEVRVQLLSVQLIDSILKSQNSPNFSSSSDSIGHFWDEVHSSHLSEILKNPLPEVRSLGVLCYCQISSPAISALPSTTLSSIFLNLINVASDESPEVRTSAFKSLGVFFSHLVNSKNTSIFRNLKDILIREWTEDLNNTFRKSLNDPSLTVRVSSCSAIADVSSLISNQSSGGNVEVALLWTQKLIATFLHCSTKGCADSEKVRIHAVRAVGSLATVLDFNPLTSLSPKKFLKWESQNLAEAILSVLEKGSVKAQWNACHSLSCLFSNSSLQLKNETWREKVLRSLLKHLERSTHFKTRIQASTALSNFCSQHDHQGQLFEILNATMKAAAWGELQEDVEFKLKTNLVNQLSILFVHTISNLREEEFVELIPFLKENQSTVVCFAQNLKVLSVGNNDHQNTEEVIAVGSTFLSSKKIKCLLTKLKDSGVIC